MPDGNARCFLSDRYVYLFPLREQQPDQESSGPSESDVDVSFVAENLNALVGQRLDYTAFARDTPPGQKGGTHLPSLLSVCRTGLKRLPPPSRLRTYYGMWNCAMFRAQGRPVSAPYTQQERALSPSRLRQQTAPTQARLDAPIPLTPRLGLGIRAAQTRGWCHQRVGHVWLGLTKPYLGLLEFCALSWSPTASCGGERWALWMGL